MEKKIYLTSLFSIFCDFLLKSQAKMSNTVTESCFLDGKKLNIAKLVDINFFADNEKNRQAIGFAKMER